MAKMEYNISTERLFMYYPSKLQNNGGQRSFFWLCLSEKV